jgi:hypothetical protein
MLARFDMAAGLMSIGRECTPPMALLDVTKMSGLFVLGL